MAVGQASSLSRSTERKPNWLAHRERRERWVVRWFLAVFWTGRMPVLGNRPGSEAFRHSHDWQRQAVAHGNLKAFGDLVTELGVKPFAGKCGDHFRMLEARRTNSFLARLQNRASVAPPGVVRVNEEGTNACGVLRGIE